MNITLSVIKADIGGYVGHSESHPDVIARACDCLAKVKKQDLLIDCQAANMHSGFAFEVLDVKE